MDMLYRAVLYCAVPQRTYSAVARTVCGALGAGSIALYEPIAVRLSKSDVVAPPGPENNPSDPQQLHTRTG